MKWHRSHPFSASMLSCSAPQRGVAKRRLPFLCLLIVLLFLVTGPTCVAVGETPAPSGPAMTTFAPSSSKTVRTIQYAAPDGATRAITFLSSGYQSEEPFLNDIAACRAALTNSTGGVASDPWPRYVSLLNLYAVFERSRDVGASRVKGHYDSCSFMTDCTARTVDNNLRCAFGSPNPHVLSCDVNQVRSLATYAPAQDVVVVLVNDAEPSGVGTDGVVYITNDPAFMPLMLVHYLNRAMAGLQEEYSLSITDTHDQQSFAAANCAAPQSPTEDLWQYWKDYYYQGKVSGGAGSSSLSTSEAGSDGSGAATTDSEESGHGCTLASYAAPTHGGCLMQNSSLHSMCPICRERLSLALYEGGIASSLLLNASTARLDLTAGRCPPLGYITYVSASSTGENASSSSARASSHLYLSLGPFASQSDVEISWFAADGTVLATNTQTLIVEDVAAAWTLPTTITATITDITPNVRPAWRAEHRARMTSTTAFVVALVDDAAAAACAVVPVPDCYASPLAFATTAALPASSVCAVANASLRNANTPSPAIATTAAPDVVHLPALDATVTNPPYRTSHIIASFVVCGWAAVLTIAVPSVVFACCVNRRSHAVLHLMRKDSLVFFCLAVGTPIGIAMSAFTVAAVISFVPFELYTRSPVVLTVLVLAGVQFVVAGISFAGLLFRRFVMVLCCGVVSLFFGAGFLATGLFSLIYFFDRGSQSSSQRAGELWMHLLSSQKGSDYLCATVQASLKCSGYHAGCFLTPASPECPLSCAENRYYVNSCEVPFTYYVGGLYMPVAVAALVCGFWFVLLGTLDAVFFVLFRQLVHNGQLRRTFRRFAKPPMAPITFQEVVEVRRMFGNACAKPSMTLQDEAAICFLEAVFAEPLTQSEKEALRAKGPLTFDALMSLHFPYVVAAPGPSSPASPSPSSVFPANRQGVAAPADDAPASATHTNRGQGAQQQQQQAMLDMDSFVNESGALSPEELHRLLQECQAQSSSESVVQTQLIGAIRNAAAHCASAPYCRGLSASELAGLRGVWTALHPAVSGTLTDDELRTFYAWSHTSASAVDDEGLAAWKRQLNVSGARRGIGWPEFCYPYAQRALLRSAQLYLTSVACEISSSRVVSRAAVAACYGDQVCNDCFLPHERDAPAARVVAHLLAKQASAMPPQPTRAPQRSFQQRAKGILRELKQAK